MKDKIPTRTIKHLTNKREQNKCLGQKIRSVELWDKRLNQEI